ncbi:DUF4143 domain-containing protein [Adlercreutzia sp. ZJ154]|uniref:DUF4143 domain-containing protein n=1 Tax=Adlercreutzia sp. ZJ154 TaxID=2709790 RepID=UPI001981A068|nr:DUF4143 domain-containing protein [Adlercreutzia sp. ZJ154]
MKFYTLFCLYAEIYADFSAFKLFCLDVGLLGAMCDLNSKTITEGSALFTEFKGALAEQYVEQELIAQGLKPAYWSSEKGTAETDFAVELGGRIFPIEVKAGENLKSKSLKVACENLALSELYAHHFQAIETKDGWLIFRFGR